jgi:hypothetical protein
MNKFYDQLSGRTLTSRSEPFIVENVFESEYFTYLIEEFEKIKQENILTYSDFLGRYGISTIDHTNLIENPLNDCFDKIIDLAKEVFKKDVKPTYAMWGLYRGFRANLPRHIDDNACTYTIDLCLSQKYQWPLWVEGKEYHLDSNQALCYYGEDQYHWRNEFPNPAFNEVQMIFFHFAEPDHWFFTKGQDYFEELIRLRLQHEQKNGIKR